MNCKTRSRILLMVLVAMLVLESCTPEEKKVIPIEKAAPPAEIVSASPVSSSQTVLQTTFTLKSTASFPFEIPAHSFRPHLHGIFTSFVRDARVKPDNAANVNFLILSADQYKDFVGDRPSEALFSVEASHNQSVNLDLPPSLDQPTKYYLIFRSSTGSGSKVVEADFHVDF